MKEFLKERGAVPQAICTLGAALTPCLSRLQACKRPQCWLEQANMDEDTRLSHELFKPLEQAEQAKPKFGTLLSLIPCAISIIYRLSTGFPAAVAPEIQFAKAFSS